MPENTSITTQSELADVNFALQELANNLGAHANGSLSEGHGINIFPGRNPDPYGNDLTYFMDALGNVVGTYHICFLVDGIQYWVPGQATTLPGQDAARGVTDINLSSLVGSGGDNWITKFTNTVQTYISQVQDTYLIPHTRLGHWQAHGTLIVEPQTTYNSAGVEVGNYIIRLGVNGGELKIVANTRFSGPVQWWHNFDFACNTASQNGLGPWQANYCKMGADDNQYGYFFYRDRIPFSGTLPRQVIFQLWSYGNFLTHPEGSWADIPAAGGAVDDSWWGGGDIWHPVYGSPGGPYTWPEFTAYNLTHPQTAGLIRVHTRTGNDGGEVEVSLRVKVISNYGIGGPTRISYSDPCQFFANDEDGCGLISGPDTNGSVSYKSTLGVIGHVTYA